MEKSVIEQEYHHAKQWEIGLFSLNNSATNLYLLAFGFLTYYATGIVGLATLTVTNLMGFARLFDGLIDPTIGVLIDRTDTKFGKFRPFMVIGNLMLILSFLILFNTHHFDGVLKIVVYIFALIFHKIGYSLQQTVTKAAQPALTNDPKQRPLFSVYDTIFSSIGVFTIGQYVISNILVPRNLNEFNLTFFRELIFIVMSLSAVYTILAVIGISRKDKKEFWGLGEGSVETKTLKDYLSVIKGNRPLQLLAVSGGVMKFVGQLYGDAIATVMLFGIVLGDYGINGRMSLMQIVPNLILVALLTRLASKKDLKFVYTLSIIVGIISTILMGILLITANGSGLLLTMFTDGHWFSYAFLGLFIVTKIMTNYPNSIVLIMAADISDYETARSGRFVSGLIGTVFSLVDSISSSLVPVISGWIVALLGYRHVLPAVGDALTAGIFKGALAIYVGIPLALLIVTLVIIIKYPLNSKEMKDIQLKIKEMKKENNIEGHA